MRKVPPPPSETKSTKKRKAKVETHPSVDAAAVRQGGRGAGGGVGEVIVLTVSKITLAMVLYGLVLVAAGVALLIFAAFQIRGKSRRGAVVLWWGIGFMVAGYVIQAALLPVSREPILILHLWSNA